nr:DUF748 domain-containing protein [Cupriavidus sp. AU9028]
MLHAVRATAVATPRRRAALWLGAGTAAAVALFGLAGWFGGPPLLRAVIASQASEALGRKVTVETASVRPFALAASLGKLSVMEPDGVTPMLSIASVEADASIASLWRLAPVVDSLHVDGVSLRVGRDAQGRFSFDDIRQRLAARPAAPDGEPARFSINNIALTGSSIVFDDRLLGETQRVEHLTVTLPFLSNLPHDVNIVTQPTLSAHLNGSPLAVSGTMLPFADDREAQLNIDLDGLDLTRFAPFVPRLNDARIEGGRLDTRLVLGFRQQQAQQHVELSGTATLQGAELRRHNGDPLLKAERIAVDLAALAPAERRVHLKSVQIDGIAAQLWRRRDGTLDLASALLPATPSSVATPSVQPSSVPAPASAPAAPMPASDAAASSKAGAEPAWRYAVDVLQVRDSRVTVRDDAAPSGPGTLALAPIEIRVEGLAGDSEKPARVEATVSTGNGQTLVHQGQLSLQGKSASGTLMAAGIEPQALAAWWPAELQVRLGQSAVNAELHYRMSWAGPDFALALDKSRIELERLQVWAGRAAGRQPAAAPSAAASSGEDAAQVRRARARGDLVGENLPLLAADKISADGLQFDLAQRRLSLAQLRLDGPELAATRDHRGQLIEAARLWSAQRPAAGAPRGAAPGTTRTEPRGAPPTAPAWQVSVGAVRIDDGRMRLADLAPAAANRDRPVVHQLRGIRLETGTLRWPLANAALPLKLQAQSGRRGSLSLEGTVQPTLPAATLQVDVRDVELAPLQPYLGERFNAGLRAGNATVQGRLEASLPAGKPPQASFAGSAKLSNVRTVDRTNGEDFVRWRNLGLAGIDFRLRDKAPMQLAVRDVALSDFYARLILNANGRLNLQDVMRPDEGGEGNADAQPGKPTGPTPLTQASNGTAASGAAGKPASAATGPAPVIRVGGVRVEKGNINFSDFYVKPNYTANLTGMKGSISGFATGEAAPADVVLEGRLDDDAPVTISGKLNPLGQQLYLDIAAKAAGVELTRLTPYAAKYAGYPITKGKMTVDVAYKIENGQLNASNHLFLEQLTFGDRVESADATKLPVLLAVSLLKDRNGVIDINLPVSGSLSDPEFSIGGVIGRVIVNLLTRAITSPFSLLASAFGGSAEELGHVDFAAGSAELDEQARKRLGTLATALKERPALRLEITGRIDPVADAAGARKAWLQEQVTEEKIRRLRQAARQQSRSAAEEEGQQGARVTVSAEEYPTYLEAVYKRADFSKPRNMIGLARPLPVEQMEALLLEHAPVTDAGLRQLAEKRALIVKQTLEREGKVPSERLFLTAPKVEPEKREEAEGKAGGKAIATRVDFALRQS